MLENFDIGNFGLPLRLTKSIRVNLAKTAAEGIVRPIINPKQLNAEFKELTGWGPEEFVLTTRIFEFYLLENDNVILQAAENRLPLIVQRDEEIIVNFDIRATQAYQFVDSKRPIYTYIPGFNIQKIPEGVRRSISNFIQSLNASKQKDIIGKYRRLPLTSFEIVILLLNKILAKGSRDETPAFKWPSGKSSVFISLHDVDTEGFLRRRERDPLFIIEQNHQIHSTWFVPTGLLSGKESVNFLLQSGNEIGWHGHKHDHRLPYKPFANQRVHALMNSFLSEPGNFPTGMRTPKLLKSNYLFNLLERNCPAMCYDTSFLQGIIPYYLWVNGSQTKILEIPTTIPTDILVYNQLHWLPRSRRPEIILRAQIERSKKLIEAGGIISIVTHPEKHLTERPDFLEIYDQYLKFINSCPDIWITTAGQLYKYWTNSDSHSKGII